MRLACASSVLAFSFFVLGCSNSPEQAEGTQVPATAAVETRLGGCIQTEPVVDLASAQLALADRTASHQVVATDQFPPFTKTLVVHGLTLVARDEIDDEFLRLVAQTTDEIFREDETLDLEMQQTIRLNQLRFGSLIPVPVEEQLDFLEDEPAWPGIEAAYSVCDIIMAEVPNQVMEVVEHILHYVTDIGLHHTFPGEWGLNGHSALRQAMELAIERGYYVIDSYSDIEDPAVRDRVVMQEFAYWFISTAWDLQEDYGPREEEWQIRKPEELAAKLPEFYAIYESTVGTTMAAPGRETLEAIGPTRQTPGYLGQTPPGVQPQLFAPGLVSQPDQHEFGSVFSADGLEFFFGVDLGGRSEIRGLRYSDGAWGPPTEVVADEIFSYNDPFLSLDGQSLYFISNRSVDGSSEPKDYDIWFAERTSKGWSKPQVVPGDLNSTADEYYISFTNEGDLVFASNVAATNEQRGDFDLYSSRESAAGFGEPVRLSGDVNTDAYEADAFVAPDGTYLIFSSNRRTGLGRGDLYVSFRADDGSWLPGRTLGAPVNSDKHELCPFVSRDGRFLFYTSDGDIYWVASSLIDALRPSQSKD